MITEGVVALIWAAASMTFFGNVGELNEAMLANDNNAAWAANEISLNMLGGIGGILALLGLVAAPITSGDTAFRSARLIIGRRLQVRPEKVREQALHQYSAVRCRLCPHPDRFRHHLALFRMEQSDLGHGGAMDTLLPI